MNIYIYIYIYMYINYKICKLESRLAYLESTDYEVCIYT